MAVNPQDVVKEVARNRRSHKKSRLGCRNCKLRRVKCDERRPKCQKCTSFGVTCNYGDETADLQISFDGRTGKNSPRKSPNPLDQNLLGFIGSPAIIFDTSSALQLDMETLKQINRFQTRTIRTIGYPKYAHIYEKELLRLACSHPYLMHLVQAVTLIHDRYLESPQKRQTVAETYHWSKAAALFNRQLSSPIKPQDSDALWSAGALLGVLSFCRVDASSPEEAWPLKESDPSDLDWLKFIQGKKVIFQLARASDTESVFALVDQALHEDDYSSALAASGIEGLPVAFVQLCGLDDLSTVESNPYLAAVRMLMLTVYAENSKQTSIQCFSFAAEMQPQFRALLKQKDPRALGLMALWYAKLCPLVWWISWRAVVECRAICMYLDRYHPDETLIHDLMAFPRMQCGWEI